LSSLLAGTCPCRRQSIPGSRSHNLPAAVNGFVGHDDELVALSERLDDTRLLTLVCVGGCGNHRMVLEATRNVVKRYPQGVWA
jgi:hypothetical protein